jgi:hypothetical protein
MGFLGALFGGGGSSSSSSTASNTTNNDNRRVSTSSGDGLTAQDGSTLTLSMVDPGSFKLASNATDKSLALASQIATTLGASVGQFSTGATNSVDSMTHLLDNQQSGVQTMSQSNTMVTMLALLMGGMVAIAALKR